MREVDLLVFSGYEELAQRLLPGADDGLPRGRITVHEAVDEEGRPAVLVEPLEGATSRPAGVKRLSARIDAAAGRILSRRALFEKVLYRVQRSDTCATLAAAIRPMRADTPPDPGRDGHVLVWCADGSVFARVVRECLSLGCDRIRWAPVTAAGGGSAARTPAVLLRIESPPWFLLERWSREGDDGTPVFHGRTDAPEAGSETGEFYVRWGWRHPLAGRLRAEPGEIALADGDGRLRRTSRPEWRDLYDALEVRIEGVPATSFGAAEPPPRFTVPLTLVATQEPVDPELWLLGADDLPAVERLLGLMPEADLKHLAIAFFARTADADPAIPVAALREVITGRGRGWVNFGREGFRALSGIPTLFLPVDRALDPQIRRDRIAAAFGLQPGELLVVREDGRPSVRIPEPSFKPLSSYVDYVVTADAARLESVIAATVFDPGPLAELATLPPDAAAAPARETPKGSLRTGGAAPLPDGGHAEPAPDLPDVPELPDEPRAAPEEPQVSGTEQSIESRIAGDPPGSARDWIALADLRRGHDDHDGAVEYYENARWLDPAALVEARTRTMAVLEKQLRIPHAAAPPERARAAQASARHGEEIAALRLCALYAESGIAPEVTGSPGYLESLYAGARAAQDRLRKKTRWLVWHAALARTGDDIELERQREAILAELNQSGLGPLDRTDFVRARLAERALDGAGDGELRRTMEALTARVARIEDGRLRVTGMALLARRWAELDDIANAKKLAGESIAASGDMSSAAVARIHANAAAALLRVGDSAGVAPFEKALDMARRVTNADDRGRTLKAALDALAGVGDSNVTAPLAEMALGVLDHEDPRRAAQTLARCAPALVRIEGLPKARQTALKLASDPRVQQDAHYLAWAVNALATLSTRPAGEGRAPQAVQPLPPAALAPVLEAVRRHQRDLEDVNDRLIEGAVVLAGEPLARDIAEQMRGMPAADLKCAHLSSWAAAIQGLAAARSSDAGLADLDLALKYAWALPNDDERRRSVKRLTGVISAFGRVGVGLEMVREVVKRTEAPGVGPYFRSEVLSECVDVAARLGQRQGAFEVMATVIDLVDATARTSPGDVTFLFEVLGRCVDHAVTIGAAGESAAVIRRVETVVEEWMGDQGSPRYWTPFYRYHALAKCGRGLARLGQEEAALAVFQRILAALEQPSSGLVGLDRTDLLRELGQCLSEVGGNERLALVDRILDVLLDDKRPENQPLGDSGTDILSLVLDEVVSPASRVRAEYSRFLGAEERSIRERVANERIG